MKPLANLLSLVILMLSASCVSTERTIPPYAPSETVLSETPDEKDARMDWWREARFGMFIHWGVYSVLAGMYEGEPSNGYAEWIMEAERIPAEEYETYAKQFNPQGYNADKWVRMAKDAGMKYIVITSKHHDGFALWDSAATDYDMVDATPYGKDLLRPLVEACQKHGMRIGFYYSTLDWHHPNANLNPTAWNKDNNPNKDWDKYMSEKMIPQLTELLTNYGDIDVLWFDGEWIEDWTEQQGKGLYNYLRTIQPDLIINNRIGKGRKDMMGLSKDESYAGDFGTPEQTIPPTGVTGMDWESCITMNKNWGYDAADDNWKSSTALIHKLIDTSSKGGNLLLNVGPTAQGLIPEPSIERLAEIGDWMDVNSEAIYGSGPSPYDIPEWGRYTTKPGKLFLHIFKWPENGKLTINDDSLVLKGAYLLKDPKQSPVQYKKSGDIWTLTLPDTTPDPAATVLVLEIEGEIAVKQTSFMNDTTSSMENSVNSN